MKAFPAPHIISCVKCYTTLGMVQFPSIHINHNICSILSLKVSQHYIPWVPRSSMSLWVLRSSLSLWVLRRLPVPMSTEEALCPSQVSRTLHTWIWFHQEQKSSAHQTQPNDDIPAQTTRDLNGKTLVYSLPGTRPMKSHKNFLRYQTFLPFLSLLLQAQLLHLAWLPMNLSDEIHPPCKLWQHTQHSPLNAKRKVSRENIKLYIL
jgi:hypothetical protein